MAQRHLNDHNVIATFPDPASARRAVETLHEKGIDSEKISYLQSRQEGSATASSGAAMPSDDSAEEVPREVGKSTGEATATGAAVGGAAGFLAGLAAFGIPGAGPLIGTGVWASMAGGAAAGAAAGGVSGGISKMWKMHYQDAVSEGGVLVGVHSPQASEAERASDALQSKGARRIDRLDSEGHPVA